MVMARGRTRSTTLSVRFPRPLEDAITYWARLESRENEEIGGDPLSFSEAVRQLCVLGLVASGYTSTHMDELDQEVVVDEWKLPST